MKHIVTWNEVSYLHLLSQVPFIRISQVSTATRFAYELSLFRQETIEDIYEWRRATPKKSFLEKNLINIVNKQNLVESNRATAEKINIDLLW